MNQSDVCRISLVVEGASIELEGSREYVDSILIEHQVVEELAKLLRGSPPTDGGRTVAMTGPLVNAKRGSSSPVRRGRLKQRNYAVMPDLELGATEHAPSLGDFMKEKDPRNRTDFIAVVVFYLKNLRALSTVNSSHVYTCYKVLGRAIPTAFAQSFVDARGKARFIRYENADDDISLTIAGENRVEHELPEARGEKKR